MKGSPPAAVSSLLLLLSLADTSFLSHLSGKSAVIRLLRHLILSSFLFLLRLFPTNIITHKKYSHKSEFNSAAVHGGAAAGDSAIGRALNQLLSIMNGVPVSSRKYEVVRSLAESIINENLLEGSEVLRGVNRTALSSSFDRTLSQLESAVLDRGKDPNWSGPSEDSDFKVSRVMRAVQYCGDVAWARLGGGSGMPGGSGEKLAAEALWLAEKMAACGCVEEAVFKWASARQLAWLALSAEPRLQCSLVRVSAFLLKHAKNLGQEEEQENKQHTQTKMRMLMSWLPLLCRASNGTDTPVMSIREKTELERVLEDIIEMLDKEEQEKVLSLWLQHFTYCSSSDWPNLHMCYSRWCDASRKRLLFQ